MLRKAAKVSGMRCARCGVPYPVDAMSRAKAAARRWLGLGDPHFECWTRSEILAISREIGAIKGLLIDKGACSIEDIDAEIERHKAACGE